MWVIYLITPISKVSALLVLFIFIVLIFGIDNFVQLKNEKLSTLQEKEKLKKEKLKNKKLLQDIKALQQNQLGLNHLIEQKDDSIDKISKRANTLGSAINTLIAQDTTGKLAPYINNLLQIGEYTNDK